MCSKCGTSKSPSDFSPSPRHRTGLFPWCKRCKSDYQVNYIHALPKKERQRRQKAWRDKRDADKEARARYLTKSTEYALKSRYGLTTHQVVELATYQGEVCAICGDLPSPKIKRGGLHVDHDHATGEVRGLLCEPCNKALGFFKDDTTRLASAIDYLKAPPASKVSYTQPIEKPTFKSLRNPSKNDTLSLSCLECGTPFKRSVKTEHERVRKGKQGPFCNRTCAGKWSQEQRDVQGLTHGTTNGYTYYKCRCPECKRAHRDAERERIKHKRSSR